MMNDELKQHIIDSLTKGVRMDGRKNDEFRDLTLDVDVSATSEGSCRVKAGDSEIIVGVKMSIGTPFGDTPEEGVLMVNAEMLPLSNPAFESGPPSIDSIESSRVIDRGIRESGVIDVKELCVEAGEKVWMINVDVCPINYDGNMIDLGTLGAVMALKTAKFPEFDGTKVDYEKKSDKGLKLSDIPLAVTVFKIGSNLIVDPTFEEMKALDARLTISQLSDGTVVALQKGGESPLTTDDVSQMIDMAWKSNQALRKKIQ